MDAEGGSRQWIYNEDGTLMDPNRSLHNGYNQVHLKYNEYVGKELDRILKEGKALNAGDLFNKNRVNDLMDDLRKGLMSGEIRCG